MVTARQGPHSSHGLTSAHLRSYSPSQLTPLATMCLLSAALKDSFLEGESTVKWDSYQFFLPGSPKGEDNQGIPPPLRSRAGVRPDLLAAVSDVR